MFCARCGKIVPPTMQVVNGNCPDWACIKVPRVALKPKVAVIKVVPVIPKTVSKPVKVIPTVPNVVPVPVVIMTPRSNKSVKIRNIKFEWNSKYVRPWK